MPGAGLQVHGPVGSTQLWWRWHQGQAFMVVRPAAGHLYELRAQLFAEVVEHDPRQALDALLQAFEPIGQHTLEVPMQLGQSDLNDLLSKNRRLETHFQWVLKNKTRSVRALLDGNAAFPVAAFLARGFASRREITGHPQVLVVGIGLNRDPAWRPEDAALAARSASLAEAGPPPDPGRAPPLSASA